MSLHPPKPPFFVALAPKAAAVPRPTFTFCGIVVNYKMTRRPRIARLEASRPRGCGVGEKPITFPEYGS